MADQDNELKKVKRDLAALEAAHRDLSLQFSIAHHLLIALAHQCNSPPALHVNFAAAAQAQRDHLLNSPLTDGEIDRLEQLFEEVGKQLPPAPQTTAKSRPPDRPRAP